MNNSPKIDYPKGILAGAIAGLADGIVSNISNYTGGLVGLWEFIPFQLEIGYIISLFFLQVEWNIIWGAVFGLGYAMVYDRIPGKGVIKGLIFSLLFYFLLADVRTAQISWSVRHFTEYYLILAKVFLWVGFFAFITFGLVLGYLYKPKK